MARSPSRKMPESPRARSGATEWLVVILAAAGLAVSGYLAWLKLAGGAALLCEAGGGCDIVQASRYATILGAPTALWGTGFYLVVGALALVGFSARRWLWTFVLAVAGASFSLYLTFVSLFVIGAACPYCLASTAIAVALMAMILWRRPPASGRRSSLRWARVVPLGGISVLLTVVGAAAIFASYPGGATAYQTALARHLADTKAVMYGAHW